LIIFELTEHEGHPAYQALAMSNLDRQYDFLQSIVQSSIEMGCPYLSQAVIKALNYHTIACLHTNAGEYRPGEVLVGGKPEDGGYAPPANYRVSALMDAMVNTVNRNWETADALNLATFVLWRLNHIHPFFNGNGRTARAACYFILCVSAGGLLPGKVILPELLRKNRPQYVAALKHADASLLAGSLDLAPLHGLVQTLVSEQLESANGTDSPEAAQDGGEEK